MAALCGCGAVPSLPKRIRKETLEEMASKTKLTPAEVKTLYARFRRLAPSGYLGSDQFRQTMGVLGLTDDHFISDRMFRVFDTDQDERLSFSEFASALAIMLRGSEDEKLALSFHMLAGREEGSGVRLDDFQRLVASCKRMMSSLVAPTDGLTTEEDAERLFHDLASGESDGQEVITLDAYKAAAQSNDEFLACLGLEPMAGARTTHRRQTRQFSALSVSALRSGREQAADRASVSKAQLEDLRRRIAALQKAAANEPRPAHSEQTRCGDTLMLVSSPKSEYSKAAASSWIPGCGCTPLPKGEAQLPCTEAGTRSEFDCSAYTPATMAVVCRPNCGMTDDAQIEERSVKDEIGKELEAIMSLCSKWGGTSDGLNLQNVPEVLRQALRHQTTSRGSRELSRDSEDSRTFGQRVINVHSPANQRKPPGMGTSSGLACKDAERQLGRQKTTSLTSKRQRKHHRLLGPKKGLAVHFGHENWNMVLSMMIGIRMSIGRSVHELQREIQPVDFIMKEKFSILPRMANILDSTVSKRITVTRFIDYAPVVFQRIRSNFGIQTEEYLRSIGPEQLLGNMVLGNLSSLSELSSEGKSGAFFYYTADGQYMLKTVTHKEQQLLKTMLKRYYDHIIQYPGTLMCRFLGLHCLSVRKDRKASSPQKLYFVVMGNMFNTPFEIHRRYDLKGSWVGRVTKAEDYDSSVALKDVDFSDANEAVRVGSERRAKLLAQIERDSAFLRENNIIDYSLLLGIYDLGTGAGIAEDSKAEDGHESLGDGNEGSEHGRAGEAQAIVLSERTPADSVSVAASDVAVNVTATDTLVRGAFASNEVPVHQCDMGGILSSDQKSLYFLGIIDILTPYDSKKHFEHWFKGLRHDYRGVSCCPPAMYAERFNKFMSAAIM